MIYEKYFNLQCQQWGTVSAEGDLFFLNVSVSTTCEGSIFCKTEAYPWSFVSFSPLDPTTHAKRHSNVNKTLSEIVRAAAMSQAKQKIIIIII